jgi:hypothetical protein
VELTITHTLAMLEYKKKTAVYTWPRVANSTVRFIFIYCFGRAILHCSFTATEIANSIFIQLCTGRNSITAG